MAVVERATKLRERGSGIRYLACGGHGAQTREKPHPFESWQADRFDFDAKDMLLVTSRWRRLPTRSPYSHPWYLR